VPEARAALALSFRSVTLSALLLKAPIALLIDPDMSLVSIPCP
jgi:hypothetical protein